jgi:hypothetical protein
MQVVDEGAVTLEVETNQGLYISMPGGTLKRSEVSGRVCRGGGKRTKKAPGGRMRNAMLQDAATDMVDDHTACEGLLRTPAARRGQLMLLPVIERREVTFVVLQRVFGRNCVKIGRGHYSLDD